MLSTALQEIPEKVLENPAHQEFLIEGLLRLRTVNEYRTDIFLNEPVAQKLGEHVRQVIRTAKPLHNIHDRLGGALSWFSRNILLDDSPKWRQYMQWFLGSTLEVKDEREWMSRVVEVGLQGIFSGSLPDPSQLDTLSKKKKSTK
jgi:hypothetical protein